MMRVAVFLLIILELLFCSSCVKGESCGFEKIKSECTNREKCFEILDGSCVCEDGYVRRRVSSNTSICEPISCQVNVRCGKNEVCGENGQCECVPGTSGSPCEVVRVSLSLSLSLSPLPFNSKSEHVP